MEESGEKEAKIQIPNLYETEEIPTAKKTIYQKWEIPSVGFYWLIAELDSKQQLAFGYANLNDDAFAEWGYISMEELSENNATRCTDWAPCPFEEALRIMSEKRKSRCSL